MSRSYKKPWIKDKGTYWKKLCNRIRRHKSRQICHMYVKSINDMERFCLAYQCTCEWEYVQVECGYCAEIGIFPVPNEC